MGLPFRPLRCRGSCSRPGDHGGELEDPRRRRRAPPLASGLGGPGPHIADSGRASPGGRQLWRRTSSRARGGSAGPAGRPAIRSSSFRAAAWPSSYRGTRTVVSGGVTRLAYGTSSHPTIERSAGHAHPSLGAGLQETDRHHVVVADGGGRAGLASPGAAGRQRARPRGTWRPGRSRPARDRGRPGPAPAGTSLPGCPPGRRSARGRPARCAGDPARSGTSRPRWWRPASRSRPRRRGAPSPRGSGTPSGCRRAGPSRPARRAGTAARPRMRPSVLRSSRCLTFRSSRSGSRRLLERIRL